MGKVRNLAGLHLETAWRSAGFSRIIEPSVTHRPVEVERFARVINVVRTAARQLLGADGVTFVLREGDHVHYAEEDAVGPLWKGQRFPVDQCG